MALKDFDSYQRHRLTLPGAKEIQTKWQKMSLANIAGTGIFSADRSVEDYARDVGVFQSNLLIQKIIGQLLGATVRFLIHITPIHKAIDLWGDITGEYRDVRGAPSLHCLVQYLYNVKINIKIVTCEKSGLSGTPAPTELQKMTVRAAIFLYNIF